MNFEWIAELRPRWDEDKARIVGGAPKGVFDRRYAGCAIGDALPGDWWRVAREDQTVGYGWLDIVWGDAEILLATAPSARGLGVGTFILEQLAHEARKRGVNYVYNTVRPTHPERESVTAWLQERGFVAAEDGSLRRRVE